MTFREVLARPDIEAVLIAVPYHWAAMLATMAVRAGKDVYCEKPIAITVREASNLVETCKRYSTIYQAGTQQRSEYAGKFRTACDLSATGASASSKRCMPTARRGRFDRTIGPRTQACLCLRGLIGISGSGLCRGGRMAAKRGMRFPAALSVT